VHRDDKPDNVILAEIDAERHQPKLLDFGVVKTQAMQRYLTHTGTVVGSPPYMSPEQARGDDDIDHLADIWAVCVMLYEAVAGALPFRAANYHALLRRIVEEEPYPLSPGSPSAEALASIILKGLNKERSQRWQSADALGCALAEWLGHLGIVEDLTGRRLSGRWTATGRKTVAERRRASITEVPTIDRLEAARAIQAADLQSRDAVTLSGTSLSAPPRRPKAAFVAAGAAAILVAVGVGLFAASGPSADLAKSADLAAQAKAPAHQPAEVPEPPAAAEPSQAAEPLAAAEPVAVAAGRDRDERSAQAEEETPRLAKSTPKAPQSTPRAKKAPPAQKPPAAAAPKRPPAVKAPTSDLGLKDPY
jgi:serine/threonine-protein kinase